MQVDLAYGGLHGALVGVNGAQRDEHIFRFAKNVQAIFAFNAEAYSPTSAVSGGENVFRGDDGAGAATGQRSQPRPVALRSNMATDDL